MPPLIVSSRLYRDREQVLIQLQKLRIIKRLQQQMYEITKQLEEGVKELFTSERYAEYLKTMTGKYWNRQEKKKIREQRR